METKKIISVAAWLALGTVFGVAIAKTKAGSKIEKGIRWGQNKLGLRREDSDGANEREERSDEKATSSEREDRR